jgi:hypothetical protein
MTCADVERILPDILEDTPAKSSTFDKSFQIHLNACPDCSALVSDLKMISSAASELADAEEPSPRVWVRLAAELRAEGIIREPESMPLRSRPARWNAWWLVPITAAVVAGSSYVISHRAVAPAAPQQASARAAVVAPAISTPPSVAATTSTPLPTNSTPVQPQVAANTSKPAAHLVEPGPSAEDQQFLSEVSTRAPSMRVTYQNQLQAVNAEIQEVQSYLKQNPADVDARQQLMDAYQQKALLYQIALDRIQ